MLRFQKKLVDNVVNVTSVYTIYDLDEDSDYYFAGESHPFYEINVVLEGTLGLTINDELYELKKGHGIIIPPEAFHKNWVIGQENVRLFVVSFDLQSDVKTFEAGMVYNVPGEDLFYVETILKEGYDWIRDEDKKNVLGTQQIIKNSVEGLIISMLRQRSESSMFVSSSGEIFYKAIHFMNKNIKKNITMEDLAKTSGTSVANIKKVFKKYTGSGAIHHFNMMKLDYSKELLRQETPISEISYILSYSSQNHFAQSFKKAFGVTPSEFKKNLQK